MTPDVDRRTAVSEFAPDSPLEGGVSCELVSENAKFPCLGIYREFHRFGPRRRLGGSEKGHEISFLRANSLRILTGNFLRPCRELNRAIREVSAVINRSYMSKLEKGASYPGLEIIAKLATVLEVEPAELLRTPTIAAQPNNWN